MGSGATLSRYWAGFPSPSIWSYIAILYIIFFSKIFHLGKKADGVLWPMPTCPLAIMNTVAMNVVWPCLASPFLCVKVALLGHASFVFKCLREEQIACQDSHMSWDICTLCEHVLP